MARLNEPPVAAAFTAGSTENADALRRRFVRQNRELAKNNSTQSLRIRGLEIEVSRLLAANLDLREQVLQLQHELDTGRVRVAVGTVERVKDELRAKIAELSGLVDGLDDAVEEGGAVQQRERGSVQGTWRERQPLSELLRETQMPTITEDKLYPRRTLGADEIQAIRLSDHSSNESPDLGPPPVVHFEYEDPVKPTSPLTRKSPDGAEDEDLPADFSANLETRRRRKDGASKIQIRRGSALPQSPKKADAEAVTATTVLRIGAKRKLSDRELDIKPNKLHPNEGFNFTRRGAKGGTAKPADRPETPAEEASAEDEPLPVQKPARIVLGNKSTNMSPRKTSAPPEKHALEKPANPDSEGARRQPRTRRASSIPLPSPPRETVIASVEIPHLPPEPAAIEPPPETPAAPDDFFSPTPSEPSARINESRDTPPPSDLSSVSSTGDGVRQSRRARSAVSYAEPSLVAKMRRPGKQLADAITGLRDPRLAMSSSSTVKKGPPPRTIIIKKEPRDDDEEDDAWRRTYAASRKAEPASPLNERSTAGGSPLPACESFEPELLPERPCSSSIAGLPELSTATRKRRSELQDQPLGTDVVDIEAARRRMEELDIYEFKDSSSSPPATTKTSHRRHSAVPKALGEAGELMEKEKEKVPVIKPAVVRSERAAGRRRSMIL